MHPRARSTAPRLLSLAMLTAVLTTVGLLAWPHPAAAAEEQPSRQQREEWRQRIVHTPKPGKGCYAATYPEDKWREVPCGKSNGKIYPPRAGAISRVDTVGGSGPDVSAKVTGTISQAQGSFDSVNGLTSESNSNGVANSYSLQLNTNFFSGSSVCNNAPDKANCQGWEQFVYDSSGSTQIQYWLLNWGKAGSLCPTPRGASCKQNFVSSDGWCPQTVSGFTDVLCVVDAAAPPAAAAQVATGLGQLAVVGFAAQGGNPDSMTMTVGNTVTTGSGGNYFPDLASKWTESEFNVFGDSNDTANFNNGTTIQVRTSVASGTSAAPSCDLRSFTAEANNLTLVATDDNPSKSALPSLVFTESNAPGSMLSSCAGAVSLGDTHMTTFDGLHYDFQAAGEFVLAQSASGFTVQARQASGAPTWPQAAVNKAVAIRIGGNRVAIYLAPERVVVNGAVRTLADGQILALANGVRLTRHGNQYVLAATDGDNVHATLNPTWMDLAVGLGRASARTITGLLGNPGGNAHALATSTGQVLAEPIAFDVFYHAYADSWRVKDGQSLFAEPSPIKPAAPSKPFFAKDLDPAAQERARTACRTAGVTHPDLLEDCTLDATVLNDAAATRVFVPAPPRLLRVIKPVM